MSTDRRKALHDLSESALQGLWNQERVQVLTASRDLLASALDELEALRAIARAVLRAANELTLETQPLEEAVADIVRLVREVRAQRDELLAALRAVDQGEVSVLAEDGSAWQALEDETWRLVRLTLAKAQGGK